MKKKRYDQEFKEQIVRECQEVGNAALVARRHREPGNVRRNRIEGLLGLKHGGIL